MNCAISCYCYNIFPRGTGNESPFFLMYGPEQTEGWLTHLNNCSRYYGDNKGKVILTELHMLWKHHAAYLRDIHNRKDNCTPPKPTNITKFEIGQTVMAICVGFSFCWYDLNFSKNLWTEHWFCIDKLSTIVMVFASYVACTGLTNP